MTENTDNWSIEKLRRKRDQEWELAGCARRDGDTIAENEHTALAREYARKISELLTL